MTLLILGIIAFAIAHLAPRIAPGPWAELVGRFGRTGARAILGVVIAAATLMIILGYRSAPFTPIYDPPEWGIHLNNLMMLAAVFVFGMSMSKGTTRSWLRHPMMTAVVIWASAHLLVNGDLASIVLFVGMALWAQASMVVVNLAEPDWQPPAPGTVAGDIRLVAITIVAFIVITAIHTWLGYWPFPR